MPPFPPLQEPVGHVAAVKENPLPIRMPPLGLSAVPLPTKTRKTLPGCHVAEADGPATAAIGAATAVGPEPPALIAVAVWRAALTATRLVKPATGREAAAAGLESDTPTDGTGVSRAARLAAAAEGRRATPLCAVADAPRLA